MSQLESNTELEAAVFRRLLEHLDSRKDVQNIELMNLAGCCRNCLSNWYKDAAAEKSILPDDMFTAVKNAYGVSDTGMVVLFYGSARGLVSSGRTRRVGQDVRGADEQGDQFGARLATGDFDADGRDEVIVGVPREDYLDRRDAGAVYPVDG